MSEAPDISSFTKEEIKNALNEIRHPISVAVYGSKNYYNAASIIRTCHNFLVKEIILIDCPCYYERATMGTHKFENINKLSLQQFLNHFSDSNIVAFEKQHNIESKPITTFIYPSNPVLFFGSEDLGIPTEVLNIAHSVVSIPQFGVQNSFNVSVAASIAIYDWYYKNRNSLY